MDGLHSKLNTAELIGYLCYIYMKIIWKLYSNKVKNIKGIIKVFLCVYMCMYIYKNIHVYNRTFWRDQSDWERESITMRIFKNY